MTKPMLTQERLKELLSYNPETGVFTWLTSGAGRRKDLVAGSLHNTRGYIVLCINGFGKLQAHRLAWLYVYGKNPNGEIDHINHIRNDNRISNLRSVDKKDNCKNKSMLKTNTSGFTGVSWNKSQCKWEAHISSNNKKIHLGFFIEFNSAKDARIKAEQKYEYHENHGV